MTTSFVYDVTVVKAGQSGQYILKPQIAESGADQEFEEVKAEGKEEKVRSRIEFEGTINSTEPLTIGNYKVVVDEDTEVEGNLEEGLNAKVEGLLQEETVLASEIKVQEAEREKGRKGKPAATH